jgi:hypothetical protein
VIAGQLHHEPRWTFIRVYVGGSVQRIDVRRGQCCIERSYWMTGPVDMGGGWARIPVENDSSSRWFALALDGVPMDVPLGTGMDLDELSRVRP